MFSTAHLSHDFRASIVVFLVALPLCLGIAVASGAPPISGIIAGIVGGIVVGALSGSQLSVSGPAAGLTAIVAAAIEGMDSFGMFLLAVVLAGCLQVLMGVLKAGVVGYFFPNSVIRGMLAAIGLILIIRQVPYALGYIPEREEGGMFLYLIEAFSQVHTGALIIAAIAMALLLLWDRPFMQRLAVVRVVPGALVAVLGGVAIDQGFAAWPGAFHLYDDHLVDIPTFSSALELASATAWPDFGAVTDGRVWRVAITIALIASIETLLSIEAADKLDPLKRITPGSRELVAQGVGNMASGLLGGLPITAVIVRSSANIEAGGKSRLSAVLHGIWLLASLVFLAPWLNRIPLAALASVLLLVGYKLVKPSMVKYMWKQGYTQFIPFAATIAAVLLTDLLVGIGIGMAVGLYYVLRTNYKEAIHSTHDGNKYCIVFKKDVSFLHRARLLELLASIPEGGSLHLDVHHTRFVDHDIREAIYDFVDTAPERGIAVTTEGLERMERRYGDPHHGH